MITAENCARTNQQLWCAVRRLPTRRSRGCCATTCFCVSDTHLTQAERERRSNDEHVEQRGGGQRAVETPEAILREDTHTLISLFSLSSLFPSLHYSLSSSLSSLDLLSLTCSLSLLSSLSFLFSLFSRFFSVSHSLILSFSHSLILSLCAARVRRHATTHPDRGGLSTDEMTGDCAPLRGITQLRQGRLPLAGGRGERRGGN